MKKLIVLSLFLAANMFAAPFLVCTSVPVGTTINLQPASYTITGLPGGAITTPATTNPDGSVQLHYDLGAVANGSYTVSVTATNSAGTSASSAPFTFSLPLLETPTSPSTLSLSPK